MRFHRNVALAIALFVLAAGWLAVPQQAAWAQTTSPPQATPMPDPELKFQMYAQGAGLILGFGAAMAVTYFCPPAGPWAVVQAATWSLETNIFITGLTSEIHQYVLATKPYDRSNAVNDVSDVVVNTLLGTKADVPYLVRLRGPIFRRALSKSAQDAAAGAAVGFELYSLHYLADWWKWKSDNLNSEVGDWAYQPYYGDDYFGTTISSGAPSGIFNRILTSLTIAPELQSGGTVDLQAPGDFGGCAGHLA